jgi:serine protease
MNANHRNATIALAATWILSTAVPAAAAVRRVENPVPGSYIVVLKSDAVSALGNERAALADDRGAAVSAMARELAGTHRGAAGRRFSTVLDGFAFSGDEAAAAALAADPRVDFVEEDGVVELADAQTPPSWGLDRVDQRPNPLDNVYNYAADGTGIDLYVIDTGIRSTHDDFGGRVDTVNAYSAIDDGFGTEDCNGHGTHVAGIAGSTTYGVAKNVTLHPVRVLNCFGQGQVSDVIAAIDWITARYPTPRRGPKPPTRAIANISLSAGWTYSFDYAVDRSVAAGVTYVVAAGNGGNDACGFSPSRTPNAIKVGASDGTDAQAAFSNRGSCVDLFAPGAWITSTYNRNDSDAVLMSGTSMAAPHVAGTAALMLSINPNARPQDVKATLLAASTTGAMSNLGEGSPDRLLYSAFAGSGADYPPVAGFTYLCRGQDCTFDAKASADDWGIVDYDWDFGDGTRPGSGIAPKHKYGRNAGGLFLVTLTVTDSTGQTATIQQEVRTAW